MPLTIINAAGVRKLLPMDECIDAMEPAMIAATTGAISMPPRLVAPLIDESGTLVLDAWFLHRTGGVRRQGDQPDSRTIQPGDSPQSRVSSPCSTMPAALPVAIIDGAEVTGIRTAAASGLATRLLAREDARTCGIFGNGVQAVTHIDAMRAVRPVDEIIVWGRNPDKVQAFAQETGTAHRHPGPGDGRPGRSRRLRPGMHHHDLPRAHTGR